MDVSPSWLLILMNLPSSNQASFEGPTLIPIVRKNTGGRVGGESIF